MSANVRINDDKESSSANNHPPPHIFGLWSIWYAVLFDGTPFPCNDANYLSGIVYCEWTGKFVAIAENGLNGEWE